MKSEPRLESRAANIITKITKCKTRWLDDGSSGKQCPDYLLLDFSEQVMGALEVTSDPGSNTSHEFWSPSASKYRSFVEPKLKLHWSVGVDEDAKLKKLKPLLIEELSKLESRDIKNAFSCHQSYKNQTSPLPNTLLKHGVKEVIGTPNHLSTEGTVDITPRPIGGGYSIDSLTFAVEKICGMKDNRTKLSTYADKARIELFIWFFPYSQACSALTTFCDKNYSEQVAVSSPPKLPEEISTVWAAVGSEKHKMAHSLWRSSGGPWEVIDPPILY